MRESTYTTLRPSIFNMRWLWVFLFVMQGLLLAAQPNDTSNKYLSELENLNKKSSQHVAMLARILKGKSTKKARVVIYEILNANCQARIEIFPEEITTFDFEAGKAYELKDRSYPMVQLSVDSTLLWFDQSCLREVLDQTAKSVISSLFSRPSQYESFIMRVEEDQELLMASLSTITDKLGQVNELSESKAHIASIKENDLFCKQLLERIRVKQADRIKQAQPLDRISINGQVLFGSSNINSTSIGGAKSTFDGGNSDIRLNGRYAIDGSSQVKFNIAQQSTTTLTSSSNFQLGSSYAKKLKSFTLETGVSYNNNKNKDLTFNDHSTTKLNARIRSHSSGKLRYNVSASYQNRDYKEDASNSFSNSQLKALTIYKRKNLSEFHFGLRVNNQSSDLAFRNLSRLLPSISYVKKGLNSSSKIGFSLDQRSYEDLPEADNTRYVFAYDKTNRNIGTTKRKNLSFAYRTYPEKSISNYMDVRFASRYSKQTNGFERGQASIRIFYTPDEIRRSFTDLRWMKSKGDLVGISLDNTLHLSYPDSLSQVNRLDGYISINTAVKKIKAGPFMRWHLFYDTASDTGYDKTLNTMALGFQVQGILEPVEKLRLSFNAMYDIGSKYIRVSDGSGDPEEIQRNPTNLQLNLQARYPVRPGAVLQLSIVKYTHNTDISEDFGLTQIKSNDRTSIQLGIIVQSF